MGAYAARAARLAGRGADCHAGARAAAPVEDAARATPGGPASRWLQRGYERALSRTPAHGRWPASSRWSSVVVAGLRGHVPLSATRSCRRSRTGDVLVRCEGAPGHLAPGDEPDRRPGEPRAARRSRGPRRRCARRPRDHLRPGRRRQRRRALGDIDPRPTTTRRSPPIREVVAGYPGSRGTTSDLLARTRERPTSWRDRTETSSCACTARTSRRSRRGRQGAQALTEIDGVADAAVARPAAEPTLEIAVDLARAQQYGSQAGRRPPRGGHAAVGPRGRQPLRGAEGLRRRRVGDAGDAPQRRPRPQTC